MAGLEYRFLECNTYCFPTCTLHVHCASSDRHHQMGRRSASVDITINYDKGPSSSALEPYNTRYASRCLRSSVSMSQAIAEPVSERLLRADGDGWIDETFTTDANRRCRKLKRSPTTLPSTNPPSKKPIPTLMILMLATTTATTANPSPPEAV